MIKQIRTLIEKNRLEILLLLLYVCIGFIVVAIA